MAISTTATVGADGVTTLAFDQDAIQEDLLYTAPADLRITVLAFFLTLDAAGTVWFEDESDVNLSGKFDIGSSSPFGYKGDKLNPVFTLALGKDLQIETTGGKASGFVKLLVTQ